MKGPIVSCFTSSQKYFIQTKKSSLSVNTAYFRSLLRAYVVCEENDFYHTLCVTGPNFPPFIRKDASFSRLVVHMTY